MTDSSARFELEGVSISPDHYVDGARLASAATFEDRSPLDWTRVLGHMARGDAGIADKLFHAVFMNVAVPTVDLHA